METETNEKKDGMETEKTKETNEIKIKEKEGGRGKFISSSSFL